VAEKLLRDLSRPVYVENNELKTTTSIGISFYPSGGSTVDELLKTADAAMYQAKEHGRNNYQFFTEDMNDKAREWLALETDLQQALDKGQLVVHYQPQYDLGTGTLVGMEALLRWQHPTRGLMEPRNFIPLAEETGQITSIGNWVLHTACAQNLKWQEQGYSPVKVSVNLSSRQFQQKHLAATVDKTLRETGLQAKYLELEFKESIVMDDAEAAVFTLIELRCLGISLVIDDFGMGYSSLNHLKRFPLDKLKIDGSFVRKITSDANDAAITAATIALAHNMGLHVIAESVENEIQADFLSKQGCDDAQGYYYSQPKTAEQCAELLEKLGPEQRDRLHLSDPDT
jgi:EAL domain-containing protein (putative c-di-GMP-specific phosphodiesterase class I)